MDEGQNQNIQPIPTLLPEAPKSHNKVILIISAVVALLIIALAAYFFIMKKPVAPVAEPVVHQAPDPAKILVAEAPAGKLMDGFLPELIVGVNPVITGSAQNTTNDPTKQLIVTSYETKDSFDTLQKAYEAFFKKNQWNVVQDKKDAQGLSIMAFSPFKGQMAIINSFNNENKKDIIVMVQFYKPK